MAISPFSLIRGVEYTAVDFGHNSIKFLNCRVKNNKINFQSALKREIPAGSIQDGEIKDKHLLRKIITDIFKTNNFSSGILLMTPAAGKTFVRRLNLPKMPETELKEALKWEVQEILDLGLDNIALDYIILSENENELELLLTVMPQDILADYLELFTENLLKVKVVNLAEMAMISLLRANYQPEQPALLLDIGSNKSKIIVADSSNFYLSREIEIAGNSFSKLFLTEENSFEEAEIAKKTYQFEIDAEEEEEIIDLDLLMTGVEDNSSVQTGIKNLLANLINELNRSIDYHNERNKENLINNIYLTGGGLLLKGLVEYLQAEIDLPVAALDPWLKFNNTESAEVNKTMIAIAAGTVLSEVEYHAG